MTCCMWLGIVNPFLPPSLSALARLHIVDIGLRDPNAREKSLGFIRLFLLISPHIDEVSLLRRL